jgi:hypothetical protein
MTLALLVISYVEYQFFTGFVGKIVETLFPDPDATTVYYQNSPRSRIQNDDNT